MDHPEASDVVGGGFADAPPVRVGVVLPNIDAQATGTFEICETAREAEGLGFDSIWVGDHLTFNAPVIDSVVAASAAAAVTSRTTVGFGVLVPALRHPVWLAKQISSLQVFSGDRVELGIGLGGEFAQEWISAGVPAEERGQRTDLILEQLPAMVSGKPVQLGWPWNLEVAPLTPHGAVPKLWIGGRSDAALKRVVRNKAGWLGLWMDKERIQATAARLQDLAGPSSDAPEIGLQVLVDVNSNEKVAREELSSFIEGVYRLPFEKLERYTFGGSVESIADRLKDLVQVGVSTIVLMGAGPNKLRDLPALADLSDQLRKACASPSDF
jgi:alkanesulfonate monooxygenase SsuD/methylene tetrahydromethanopterin reductase-like flavin-dependent oxidoreductase (luciferase family)